ncbi:MAG TPA: PorP/SprF family type IX secretion system membrane protein [Paludibacteraceae bacterium]|nr:PorP/SprF family type IX secretion system membrane protein [Paludibacteraceae bacterium]HOU67479.1 PorP/SprF family type IX secretion system membrane protein [Paludibacteraceae bacterium]HPH62601.1 PorP/SprF family type IX secretion system membrane protein [Paludibacteraceae bacterium]HQF49578.1 PorP/SprF family type IX secretion system membrane protein [Paludibacteraceae bacterium]
MKKSLYIIIGLFWSLVAWGQDYTFSNHNIVPFSLNPSLVGNANAIRIGLNYRQQWPALGNSYHTVRVSYDQNFYKRMCSLGAFYTYDYMGAGDIKTNEFGLIYGHTIRLTDGYFVRLGVQGSYFYNLYGDNFEFGDQYDWGTGTILPNTSEDITGNESVSLMDFSVGGAFVIENYLTVGGAVYHIGEPENGIIERKDNKLYRKFVGHANFVYDLESSNGLWGRRDLSNKYLFVNAAYQKQFNFELAYLGAGVMISPLIGGIAVKSDIDDVNTISFMLGGTYKGFQAYYVYDLFTSSKKNGSWSHEISLIYIIQNDEKYPCPVVYW